jgi:hypothetical protein
MANNILKEAIADAKAVREVALANAKAALEEAFTPRLQSMLSAKLSEELNEEDLEENVEGIEETYMDEDEENMEETYMEDQTADLDEEIDLEEILNELELEEGDDSKDKKVEEAKEDDLDEAKKDDDKDDMKEAKDEDKDDMKEADDKELDEAKDDEIDEAVGYPNYRADQIQKVKHDASDINQGLNEGENFDLDALLEEINNLDENNEDEVNEVKSDEDKMDEAKKEDLDEAAEEDLEETVNPLAAELEETREALKTVTTELNEVNLLNSKLLYVNRIFKSNNLNEAQKLRVVETLDNASNVKEAKLIYETIKDTFNVAKSTKTTPKKSIRENLGMASKAAGTSTAPKKPVLNESNDMMTRMQKLANIKLN